MSGKKPHRGRKLTLILLLAVVCVGAVELAVCKYADPQLYSTITEPVKDFSKKAANSLREFGSSLVAAVQTGNDASQAVPEEPVEQKAGAPELDDAPPAEDPVITEFVESEGLELLTGGVVDMVYYNQSEEPWASMPYGSDPIGGYGCGPTAMAMVVSSLTDQTVDPGQMASWAAQQGYWAPHSGSYYTLIEGTANAYGLDAESWEIGTAEDLCSELAQGKIFVALMTKGHFTNSGHFIVLRGGTLEGKILVADPNSRERSLAAWEPQLILDELSPARYAGAPIWEISTRQETP